MARKAVTIEVFLKEQTAKFFHTKGRVAKPQKFNFSLLHAVSSTADEKLELTEQLEARTVFLDKPALKSAFVCMLELGRQPWHFAI